MNQANLVHNVEEKIKLENSLKNGAGWFFAIGAFSIINTIIVLLELEIAFIVGLGITQLIQGIMLGVQEASNTNLLPITVIINILFSSAFIVLGIYSKKRESWAFIVGMVLYSLDALLFLPFQDWFSFGFHIFALFGIYKGYKSLKELETNELNDNSAADKRIRLKEKYLGLSELPEEIICVNCFKSLELEENERREKKLTCPLCNEKMIFSTVMEET